MSLGDASKRRVPETDAARTRVIRDPADERSAGFRRRTAGRSKAARGVRRTYYISPDIASRFDQVVDDLAHELRIPKLDVLGALLNQAIEDVNAVRAQFTS